MEILVLQNGQALLVPNLYLEDTNNHTFLLIWVFMICEFPKQEKAQAQFTKEAGVEGFCYWHYWFGNGKRLLERLFTEVVSSGET